MIVNNDEKDPLLALSISSASYLLKVKSLIIPFILTYSMYELTYFM